MLPRLQRERLHRRPRAQPWRHLIILLIVILITLLLVLLLITVFPRLGPSEAEQRGLWLPLPNQERWRLTARGGRRPHGAPAW